MDEQSSMQQLYFYILVDEPHLHGIPGNISVGAKLCENRFELSFSVCESAFKKRHPEHEREFNSWLWITYKNICGKDINKTMDYLREIAKNSNSKKNEN